MQFEPSHFRSAPEAVSGYSAALAALLGSVPQSEAGGAGGVGAGRLGALDQDGFGASPLLSPSAGAGAAGGGVGGGRGNGSGGRTSGGGALAARGLGIPRSRWALVRLLRYIEVLSEYQIVLVACTGLSSYWLVSPFEIVA